MRIKGRTREQLKADRACVRDAKERAVQIMVEDGAYYGCDEHYEAEVDACARCRWVNEQLGHTFEERS